MRPLVPALGPLDSAAGPARLSAPLPSDFVVEARRRARWSWRWFARRPDQWVASCRDEAGRRDKLLVVLVSDDQVALVVPRGGVAVLDLLTVGRLRAAFREAVFAVEDRDTDRPLTYSVSMPQ
jgi:hypothetical protein